MGEIESESSRNFDEFENHAQSNFESNLIFF